MSIKKILTFHLLILSAFVIIPGASFCELKSLEDTELSDVYAAGFSNFSYNILPNGNTEALAELNIHIDTYTEIESLKLGYHDEYNYKNPTPSFGWDQDWINVQIGKIEAGSLTDDLGFLDPTEDFHAEGFYFSAEFENIDDPDTRELKSVKFGFDYVQGDIKADFINFSGTIDDSNNNTPEYNGHILNLGPVTITADPGDLGPGVAGGFEISLNIDTYDKGYWVTFDNAIVTP